MSRHTFGDPRRCCCVLDASRSESVVADNVRRVPLLCHENGRHAGALICQCVPVQPLVEVQLPTIKGGLRGLYRTLELPGKNPLKDAHSALDAADLAAYGFTAKADLLAQLLALNQQVAAKFERAESVTADGSPGGFPNPESLITEDCIRPGA